MITFSSLVLAAIFDHLEIALPVVRFFAAGDFCECQTLLNKYAKFQKFFTK